MKYYTALLLAFWCGTASAKSIQLRTTHYNEPSATLIYTNYKSFSTDTLVKFTLTKGISAPIATAIPHAGFYVLLIGKRSIPIFLEPNKEYELRMDYEEYPKNFKVNNRSSFHELIYTINTNWMYSQKEAKEDDPNLAINIFAEKHRHLIQNTKDLTKKESQLLEVFLEGVISIMKTNANTTTKNDSALTAHLANFSIKNELVYEVFPEKFLKSMLYNSYVLKYGKNPSLEPVSYLNYISETVNNKMMGDYLSTQFVSNQLRFSENEQASDLFAKLKSVLSADQLLQAVSKQVVKTYKNNFPLPNLTLYTKNTKKITTQSFLGKLVVIDVWALWCGPCLAERPFFQVLEKKYSNSPEVEIISVSIDMEQKQWLKDVIHSPSKNYWVDGGFRSTFAKALDIVSIPRFIIVNEKGIVIHSDAPKPSNPELYTLIDMELKRLKNGG